MDEDGKIIYKKEDIKRTMNTEVIKASTRIHLAELCQYSCYYGC